MTFPGARRNLYGFLLILPFSLPFLPIPSLASTQKVFSISIQNHTFRPDTIQIRQNQPFTLHVTNNGNHPEEFESYDLEFEIIILPHRSIDVPIRPLPQGSYEIFGDFHPRTARGTIKVLP